MVSIDGSVGEGGTNAKHDVAIVQLMLHLIKNAKGAPYYGAAYSGKYDTGTKDALAAFQKDQKIPIIPAKGVAKAGDEKSALASPAGSTFAKLSAALPAGYADMRAIPNTTTVYLPAASTDATSSSAEVLAKADLDPAFRAKIADVITTMQQRHKVALAVVGPGWRRDFATQAAQTATGAGPGESNHNFGRAVDLGFKNFRWIDGSGKIVKEGGWLGSATLGGVKSEQLWVARDVVAVKERGLFLTNFGGERVHLQNFSDASVNNRAALAKLLSTVGAMKWSQQDPVRDRSGSGCEIRRRRNCQADLERQRPHHEGQHRDGGGRHGPRDAREESAVRKIRGRSEARQDHGRRQDRARSGRGEDQAGRQGHHGRGRQAGADGPEKRVREGRRQLEEVGADEVTSRPRAVARSRPATC